MIGIAHDSVKVDQFVECFTGPDPMIDGLPQMLLYVGMVTSNRDSFGRHDGATNDSNAAGSVYMENLIAALPGEDETAKRRIAWAVLSEMIGAVILARVINPELGDELTRTVVADLLERRDRSTPRPVARPRTPHRKK